jgi:ATP-dependent Zn protease
MKRRQIIAYHESGHAVVARVLDVGLSYVTLFPTDDSLATARTHSAAHRAHGKGRAELLAALEKDVKVCFAGVLTECVLKSIRTPRPNRTWGDDLNRVSSLLAGMVATARGIDVWGSDGTCKISSDDVMLSDADFREEYDRLYERVWHETHELVREHWSAVDRVAKELLVRHALFCDEVDELIAKSGKEKKARKTVLDRAVS